MDDAAKRRIRQELGRALRPMATRIERVSVRFDDVNGPRGGVDTRCRARVVMSGHEQGRVVADLFGPILRPWTFELRVDQQVQGVIARRWRGLLKEMFTDADNLGVDRARVPDPQLRALVFAALVLIESSTFERAKGG